MALVVSGALADEPAYRHQAPITMEQPAAFVQLALPVAAYARSQLAGLQDLRVLDARDEPVPFALLAPRLREIQSVDQLRAAELYPLPPKPMAGSVWTAPIEVRIEGERIRVVRTAAASPAANARPGGWLIDLGENQRDHPAPASLRLQWSGPDEFSADYSLEFSDDLRHWRPGGGGQLTALLSAGKRLTQPNVVLGGSPARFVRLAWADVAAAPALTGAQVVTVGRHSRALDPPTEWVVASQPAPAGSATRDPTASRALHFDLGAALPVVQLDLQLGGGTRVLPAWVQGRTRLDQPWQELAASVFYRLEREQSVSRSPALELRATVRYVRVLPDPRAAVPDASLTRLVVQAQLAQLVLATQGQPPYRLQVGSSNAPRSALPTATLIPALEEERARFGRARLGEFSERAEVARAEQAQQRLAALRPWWLWSVLIAGVVALAFMVWRLARGRDPTTKA